MNTRSAFVGGSALPEHLALTDAATIDAARKDVADLLGIRAEVGKNPGFALAGNFYRGVGLPDSIAGARRAADSLTNSMNSFRSISCESPSPSLKA